MNILILDDNEIVFTAPAEYYVDPHDYRTDTVVQVASPSKFWEVWTELTWDEIWLDHDLGSGTYNGKTVTMRIAELATCEAVGFEESFVITSMNPSAAKDMESDLTHYVTSKVVRRPISSMDDLGVSRGDRIRGDTILRRNVPE